MKNDEINVGDYVEPITDLLSESVEDKSFEDLFGIVIDKKDDIITIEGIGRSVVTRGKIENFRKAEIPEIISRKRR